MNAYWNIVNGLLAGSALLSLPKEKNKPIRFAAAIRAQQKIEKVFLLNVGLDVAYITAGLVLKESSKNNAKKRDQRFGFGNSLIWQGGFLLLFDAAMYTVVHKNGKALNKVLDKININIGPTNAGILLHF